MFLPMQMFDAVPIANSPKSSCCSKGLAWLGLNSSAKVLSVDAPEFLPITFTQEVIGVFFGISCCINVLLSGS